MTRLIDSKWRAEFSVAASAKSKTLLLASSGEDAVFVSVTAPTGFTGTAQVMATLSSMDDLQAGKAVWVNLGTAVTAPGTTYQTLNQEASQGFSAFQVDNTAGTSAVVFQAIGNGYRFRPPVNRVVFLEDLDEILEAAAHSFYEE